MNSEDSGCELDLDKVKSLIESMAKDLCIPYFIRSSCVKTGKSLASELESAISEVTEKERQLNAVIGIAKILLESSQKGLKIKPPVEEEEILEENLPTMKISECRISSEEYKIVNNPILPKEKADLNEFTKNIEEIVEENIRINEKEIVEEKKFEEFSIHQSTQTENYEETKNFNEIQNNDLQDPEESQDLALTCAITIFELNGNLLRRRNFRFASQKQAFRS